MSIEKEIDFFKFSLKEKDQDHLDEINHLIDLALLEEGNTTDRQYFLLEIDRKIKAILLDCHESSS